MWAGASRPPRSACSARSTGPATTSSWPTSSTRPGTSRARVTWPRCCPVATTGRSTDLRYGNGRLVPSRPFACPPGSPPGRDLLGPRPAVAPQDGHGQGSDPDRADQGDQPFEQAAEAVVLADGVGEGSQEEQDHGPAGGPGPAAPGGEPAHGEREEDARRDQGDHAVGAEGVVEHPAGAGDLLGGGAAGVGQPAGQPLGRGEQVTEADDGQGQQR